MLGFFKSTRMDCESNPTTSVNDNSPYPTDPLPLSLPRTPTPTPTPMGPQSKKVVSIVWSHFIKIVTSPDSAWDRINI